MEDVKNNIIEILEILETADYVDPAEYLYDAIKVIKRHLRLNSEITLGRLHDFLWALNNPHVLSIDGKVEQCATLLNICIRNYTISHILE